MKRELKFRAWDTEYKEWVTDTLLFYPPSGNVFNTKRRYLGEKSDKNVILMQYTGLKDKNGKEIYEDDIVHVVYDGNLEYAGGDDEIRVVEWGMNGTDEYYPAFDLKGNDMEINALSCAKNNGDIEVIGNIYQNPELLK